MKYIHRNPVRKRLVENVNQWYYSSSSDWDKMGQGPVKLDLENFPKY